LPEKWVASTPLDFWLGFGRKRWREDPSHRLVIVGLGFSLNQRTGSRLIRQRFVNYERVKTFEFGKRIGLNQRTGSC
jgi:hypothetical protein